MINIIIADDEEIIHEDIKKSLESQRDSLFDFKILKDFYGTTPLKLFLKELNEHISEDDDVVLILDNLFNSRQDGLQSLSNIRKNCPRLPIIMLTTSDDDDRAFTLARSTYNIDYLKKPTQGSELRYRIEACIDNMNKYDITNRIVNIENKLDKLDYFIKNEIQKTINKEKTIIMNQDDDVEISSFIEKISKYINTQFQNYDKVVMSQSESLKLYFGKVWQKLLISSRTSLTSAYVLWETCKNIKEYNFDYSGICISATAAFEAEIKKIFFVNFQNYIAKKYGLPDANNYEETFKNWPEKLLTCKKYEYLCSLRNNNAYYIEKSQVFNIGMIPYLFGKIDYHYGEEQSELMWQRMREYLNTILINKDDDSFFYNKSRNLFIEKCEQIRKEYRNKAAHVEIVSREIASSCLEAIRSTLHELYCHIV